MAQDRLVGVLRDSDSFYYESSNPSEGLPVEVIFSKLEKNMELGSIEAGTYQDSPHAFLKISSLGFEPKEGDEVETRGERLRIYKVLLDGEGGASLFFGNYRR